MTRARWLAARTGRVISRSSGLTRRPRLDNLGGVDAVRLGREARVARNLERVYHTGQDRIWDGKVVLAELVARHGGVSVPEPHASALHTLLSAMLWGELAAWKVSAALAARLETHEGRLAATAQAHDEARHFYVLYDYIELLGRTPGEAPNAARGVLERVIDADSLAKQLVGMQLLVEPVALTLFTVMRRAEVCPVLTELLAFLERDEARHVAVGTNLLPDLVRGMGWVEAVDYWLFQARLFQQEMAGLAELEPAIATLGFDVREVFRLGMGKQLTAARLVTDELGPVSDRAIDLLRAGMEFNSAWRFPEPGAPTDRWSRLRTALHAARSSEATPGELLAE